MCIQLEEQLATLDLVNFQIAELRDIKEKLECKILQQTGRVLFDDTGKMISIDREGEKTQVVGKYKLTIKTDYLFSINKEQFEIFGNRIPEQYNPVIKKVSYDVNKKLLRDAEQYASSDELKLLSEIITKKFAKPAIKLVVNS